MFYTKITNTLQNSQNGERQQNKMGVNSGRNDSHLHPNDRGREERQATVILGGRRTGSPLLFQPGFLPIQIVRSS